LILAAVKIIARESSQHGALLTDEMGLGKTLAILAYLMATKDALAKDDLLRTLVILLVSLLDQWQAEIVSSFKSSASKIHIYHG